MTPERREEIREAVQMDASSYCAYHRRELLAEVDRLRAALARISGHGERCRLACGQGWDSTCGCGVDAGHIADAALEGSP